MTCTPCAQARRVSSPCTLQFAELSLVVGVGNRTGAQAVALMPMMILIQLG